MQHDMGAGHGLMNMGDMGAGRGRQGASRETGKEAAGSFGRGGERVRGGPDAAAVGVEPKRSALLEEFRTSKVGSSPLGSTSCFLICAANSQYIALKVVYRCIHNFVCGKRNWDAGF